MTEELEVPEMLTPEDGFAAMFEFLNAYWLEFKTATLADVLSDVNPGYGGRSSDPAAWPDWNKAVRKVLDQRP